MLKGSFINVLPDWHKNHVGGDQYPVFELVLNEVTHIAAVRNPESFAASYPIIEPITMENDGWLKCQMDACWLSKEAFMKLASTAIIEFMQTEKYLIDVPKETLTADVYTNEEIAKIMAVDPAKLYAWMQHIKEMDRNEIDVREWISGQLCMYLHPEHLVANPVDSD